MACAVAAIAKHCQTFGGITLPSDPAYAAAMLTIIGRRLWSLNTRAVGERYREPPAEIGNFRYDPDLAPTPAQMRGSIECLSYQCAEGDVPKTALYRALTDAESVVARAINAEGVWGVNSISDIPLTPDAQDRRDRQRDARVLDARAARITDSSTITTKGHGLASVPVVVK